MVNFVCEVLLTASPLAAASFADVTETGAIVDFWGVVRRTEEDAEITGIGYEAHPAMADHQLRLIANEAARGFDLQQLWIHHRVGFVAVGEASLFVRVGSRHRAAAFEACKWIVDELKNRVPIWKHPQRAGYAPTSLPRHHVDTASSPAA